MKSVFCFDWPCCRLTKLYWNNADECIQHSSAHCSPCPLPLPNLNFFKARNSLPGFWGGDGFMSSGVRCESRTWSQIWIVWLSILVDVDAIGPNNKDFLYCSALTIKTFVRLWGSRSVNSRLGSGLKLCFSREARSEKLEWNTGDLLSIWI